MYELYFVYKSITLIVYVHHPLPALLPSFPPTRLLAYALPLSPLCRYSAPAAHMGMRLPDHAMPGAGGGELQGPGACRTDMAMGPQASSMSRTQPAAAFAEPYVPVKMRLCVLCKTGFYTSIGRRGTRVWSIS